MAKSTQDVASSKVTAGVNEFLTFTLGHEEYGMEITKVQEIRGYDAVTKLANTPDFLKGITNLRGIIVPIIDMRIKFNMEHAEYNDLTVVIIINVAHRVVGMVVDGVSDVITLSQDQVKPAPEFGGAIDTKYVMGIGAVDDRMLILVDIEKLMSSEDMDLVETAAAA
ncbi:MAG TPA: chemotaxis protein CheW [Sulfuricella sp.]|nr:chemotaxis protein CheW [Sulfuricella sp.]